MTWTDERIDELSRLWQAGHSASEIGKRLGVSKNAVVGKAHRLKLPSRPSPIKQQDLQASTSPRAQGQAQGQVRAAASKSRSPRRTARAQVTADAGAVGGASAPAAAGPAPRARSQPAGLAAASGGKAPAKGAPPRPAAAQRGGRGGPRVAASRSNVEARGSSSGCLWPIGDPGDSDFHFCGAQAVAGKPYCAEHAARAYITRSRSHADEEAA